MMLGTASEHGVFLISGVPGAGKTTVARLLARQFPLAAHIEADEIQELIVAGGLHPHEEPQEEATRQLRLRETNVSLLADSFASAGVVPVVDDVVVVASRLDRYLASIQTRPLRLVLLAPALEVALERDSTRGTKTVGHIWGHLDAVLRQEMVGIGLWIDTADLTPEQTVEAILARSDEAILTTSRTL